MHGKVYLERLLAAQLNENLLPSCLQKAAAVTCSQQTKTQATGSHSIL